jgi:hypothetical protein
MKRKLTSGAMLAITGCTESLTASWIRRGVLPKPQKDTAGNYEWSQEDVQNVRKLLDEYHRRKKQSK